MATFLNREELANIVKLYKEDKINKFSFEGELSRSIQAIAFPFKIQAIILEGGVISGGASYLIMSVPSFNPVNTIKIFIDKWAIVNLLKEEEFLRVLEGEVENLHSIIKQYRIFLKLTGSVGVMDCLENGLSLYGKTLSVFPRSIQYRYNKLVDQKKVFTVDDIDWGIRKLNEEDMNLEQAKEILSVRGILPKEVIAEYEDLARKMHSMEAPEDGYLSGDALVKDLNWNKLRAVSDKTFDREKLQRNIPHTYIDLNSQ